MNAVILAAGKGSRLGALSDETPKPLLEVGGRTILERHLERCAASGVERVFINTHHLAEKIRAFCGDGSRWNLRITYSYEPELLGTAGALNAFRDDLATAPFAVIYGDNLLEFDLDALREAHTRQRADATVAIHFREDVSTSGMVVTAPDGRIQRFVEKPPKEEQVSQWVNAAVYLLEPGILDFVPPSGFSDFGRDIFPALLAADRRVFAFRLDSAVLPVDTPELLAQARNAL